MMDIGDIGISVIALNTRKLTLNGDTLLKMKRDYICYALRSLTHICTLAHSLAVNKMLTLNTSALSHISI